MKDLSIHNIMAISIEGEMAHESITFKAMVCGYHVYKEIWCAAIGELSCMREVENYRDPFVLAVR